MLLLPLRPLATLLTASLTCASLSAPAPADHPEDGKAQRKSKQVSQSAEQMHQQLVACQAACDRLRRQLAELKRKDRATLEDLARGLAESERRAATLERIHEKLKQSKGELDQRLKGLTERGQRVQKEAAGHQKRISELEQHLRKAAEDSERQLAELRDGLKRDLEEQRQAAEKARAHAKKLHAQIEAAQAERERALAEQRTASKREISRHLAAAQAAKDARQKALQELEKALNKPMAAPKELRVAIAGKLAAEAELQKAHTEIDQLSAKIIELGASHTQTRAELVAEQVVRMRLQARVDEAEAKLAAATSKPAPPVIVKPAKKIEAAPIALAVLRFDKNADQTARDRETLLGQVRAVLEQRPEAEFDIVGHTCNTGNSRANQVLSDRRAAGVRDLLVRGGIPAEKIHTRGAGQTEPISDNSTLDGRRLNRRVEVHLRER